jgi:7-keto-8-aminopelargonate synthetase-like enzyme
MINKEPFKKLIQEFKDNGKYRVFNDVVREAGKFPTALWYGPYNIKNIVNWCSNDYLGMGQHKIVLDAMHTALDHTGSGSGGTRNIGGTSQYHVVSFCDQIKDQASHHACCSLRSKRSVFDQQQRRVQGLRWLTR